MRRREGASRDLLGDLLIAVSEASANAVLHAGSPVVKVSWKPEGDRVEVTVEDEGMFGARVSAPEPDGEGTEESSR